MVSGILVSPGIAFAKALLLKEEPIVINNRQILDNKIDAEIERFKDARAKSSEQLHAIMERAKSTLGEDKAAIFEGHIMLLEDEDLEQEVISRIQSKHSTADAAVQTVFETQAKELENLDDEYLKERAADIRDIGKRLLKNILGVEIVDLSAISQPCILVATDRFYY